MGKSGWEAFARPPVPRPGRRGETAGAHTSPRLLGSPPTSLQPLYVYVFQIQSPTHALGRVKAPRVFVSAHLSINARDSAVAPELPSHG